MKKRIAKKFAKKFLEGKLTPQIRWELSAYSSDASVVYREAFAVLPARVAREAERIGGAGGRLDTPLHLGGINWHTGAFVRNPKWGSTWDCIFAGRDPE